jgi:hypothetical protein
MSRIAPQWVGLGVGIALVAALVGGYLSRRPSTDPKVTIGKNDEVYYYRRATKEDAKALGDELVRIGFFTDRGSSVLLWMGGGPTVVSFGVGEGAWEHPNTIANFTEIGRRIAPTVGGFPLEVHLIDANRIVRKKMNVGRAAIGKDVVFYFGDATAQDAEALGTALKAAGYFTDHGVSVALLKGEGRVISFAVRDGLWEDVGVMATMDKLVRQVAPAAGGLPITLRLVNRDMEMKQELLVAN